MLRISRKLYFEYLGLCRNIVRPSRCILNIRTYVQIMYQGARDEPLYFKYSSLRGNNIPISSQRTKNDEIQSLNIGSYFVALIFTEIISTYDAHSNMFQFLTHAYEPENESYVNLNLFPF